VSAEDSKRRELGRGLSALLGEESEDYAELDRVRLTKPVPIEFLSPSRFQPRHRFDEGEIQGLVESIRENGILQPILVRRVAGAPERFEIVAGERRWRAAQTAKLHEVPVIIKDLSDGDALEIALVENLQRQDLTPVEEAEGFRRLMEEFTHTQEGLAKAVGRSRSHIANTVRLLALPDSVKDMLENGRLSAGHGRALLGAADPVARAREVVARGLNVRQTEHLVRAEKAPPRKTARPEKDTDTLALEKEISRLLGLKVSISHRQRGGTVTIRYKTLEQLDGVLQRLSHTPPAEASDNMGGTEEGAAAAAADPVPTTPDPGAEPGHPVAALDSPATGDGAAEPQSGDAKPQHQQPQSGEPEPGSGDAEPQHEQPQSGEPQEGEARSGYPTPHAREADGK
jgi:ParB family chromosome partitioning protein